jgi:hypothetical protein
MRLLWYPIESKIPFIIAVDGQESMRSTCQFNTNQYDQEKHLPTVLCDQIEMKDDVLKSMGEKYSPKCNKKKQKKESHDTFINRNRGR